MANLKELNKKKMQRKKMRQTIRKKRSEIINKAFSSTSGEKEEATLHSVAQYHTSLLT